MKNTFNQMNIILYVEDQQRSTTFYMNSLGLQPTMNVPGMTEFPINPCTTLGLMPASGIKRLLGEGIIHPSEAKQIPRCELYFVLDEPEIYIESTLLAGGKLIQPLALRDWGDEVAYLADLDGHIIAFARKR